MTWQPQLKRKVLYKLRHYSCLCYKCLFTSKYYLEAKDFDGSLQCGSDGSVFVPIKILLKITFVGFQYISCSCLCFRDSIPVIWTIKPIRGRSDLIDKEL